MSKEVKIRIGKSINLNDNEIIFQLQFKFENEYRYNGLSYDVFKSYEDADNALNKHINGDRRYEYKTSVQRMKKSEKGKKISVEKTLAFHVFAANYELPDSIVWANFKVQIS